MASTVPGVRFVRCPKCLELLMEFPDVPVYQCGGCGTILQAKIRISGGQNATLGSLGNTSQNLPDSGILNYGLSSSGKDMVSISSELDSEREKAVTVNIQSSYPNDLITSHEKVESTEHEENTTEERGFDQHAPQPTDLHGPKTDDTNIEVEKTSKLYQQGRESLKLSDRMEDSMESTDLDTSSEEYTAGGVYEDKHGTILRSPSRNSRAYDASVSSADDGCKDHAGTSHPILPEGGFAQKKVLDLIDTKGKEAEEDDFGEREMTGAKLQDQDFPAKPSNEMLDSAVMNQFDSKIDEFPSKHQIDALKWVTSLDSEDFHSVQNTLEPENGGSLRMSRDAFSCEDSLNHPFGSPSVKLKSFKRASLKILRKVDELRDELSELFVKAVEGKGRPLFRDTLKERITKSLDSNLAHHPPKVYEPRILIPRKNRLSQIPSLERTPRTCLHFHYEDCKRSMQLPPNICRHNELCRHCAHDVPCQSSKAVCPGLHIYSSLSPSCHKAKAPDVESEKLHSKEKRQPMKQYCRPVFGGAPFVICSSCSTLLKLPVDFLTSRKRLHKLQCGACSEVLLFSYRARTYSIPCTPTEARHPPSEVDNGTESSNVNEISSSHFNDCRTGDPISYSDEYRLSFGMCNSTGVEPALHVSRNSCNMMEEKDGKQGTGLRLHRLMGYSSASEILRQPFDVDDECQSLEPTMHCHRPEEGHVRVDLKGKGICIPDHSATRICNCMGNMNCQKE